MLPFSLSICIFLYNIHFEFSRIPLNDDIANRMSDGSFNLRAALPKIKENKKYIKRLEKRKNKNAAEEEKEFIAVHGRKSAKKLASKKEQVSVVKNKKERRPKTKVANALTGKETFTKHKAKELLKEKKKNQKKAKKESSRKGPREEGSLSRSGVMNVIEQSAPNSTSNNVENIESEKELLMKTIQGDVNNGEVDPFISTNFYPEPLENSGIAESEDEVLEKANKYFQKLSNKERELNRIAALHMKRMKEINRRGGDKDGFRYVIPKNTKSLVRDMMMKEGTSNTIVDPASLSSTFGSLSVAEEESDKPMRKKRKQGGTYSDFYQFQVSKRWTRNAEKFLFRDRVDKSLFESKKRQRSIKNL